jgi:spore coat protein CotH|tara:strand:- start:2075 stop:3484 length:1410 start_codon:yes stop_codon:yes gene_type:complete
MRREYVFVLLAALASGCVTADTSSPTTSEKVVGEVEIGEEDPTVTTVGAPVEIPSPNWQSGLSDYLYDQEVLHTFELTISDKAFADINSDPSEEQYVEGSLTFEGETISPVGIRYKGSVGAWVGCVAGGSLFEPDGEKTCTKLSMKVKINWEDSSRTFWGVKKLQFHSMNLDPTQMHERLGYWLFRKIGVPAPRATHARLLINGNYVGLYSFVEQIDGRFVDRQFDDGDGNLYKEVWPLNHQGSARKRSEFRDALKTNEEDEVTVDHILNFSKELAAAQKSELPQIVAKWMDVDEIIRWAVVDRAIRNDDGPLHWYCFDGCNNHNFYWYEEPTTGRLHLIPWDLDSAFANIVSDANPVTPIADKWGEITNDCRPFPYGQWNIPQWSATCDPLIGTWTTFVDEREAVWAAFLEGPFSAESTGSILEQWAGQIHDATSEAAATHQDALEIEKWKAALSKLGSSLDFARANG